MDLETEFYAFAEKTDERLKVLELDVAIIKSNYATKADIAELKTSIAEVKIIVAELKGSISDAKVFFMTWCIGTNIAMAGLAFAAGKYLH